MYPYRQAQQTAGLVRAGILIFSYFSLFSGMETTQASLETPLLEVSVDQTGVLYLKRIAFQTNWIFSLGIVVYSLTVVHSLFYIARVNPERYRAYPAYYIDLRYNIVWFVIGSVLASVQAYIYRRWARRSLKAVDRADNEAFNQAFRHLCWGNRLALASLFMYILVSFLHIWIDVEFFSALHSRH